MSWVPIENLNFKGHERVFFLCHRDGFTFCEIGYISNGNLMLETSDVNPNHIGIQVSHYHEFPEIPVEYLI